MDPRVTWYQPEQLGRATDLWTQIFDSATEELQNFHVGIDSMSKGGTGSPSPTSRSGAGNRTAQDYIPLNGVNAAHARNKKGTNGYIFGDRQDTINRKRKDNLASTYDWNHSGKLRNGGTPWRMGGQRYSGIIGLHQEIMHFYHFMCPRQEEHQMRKEVVQRIQGIVRSIWPEAKVEIYGSYRTMLYLPTSDIDLVIFGDIGDRPYFRLGNELEKSRIAEPGSIKVLDKASVPIVKLTDEQTKVRVDISFNMRSGTECAKLIEEFIVQYPSLPFLVFVLKQFLLQRDLNEVWTGGISSYSLILMIVSFLQLHAPPEPENLGVLLIEFFELYGNNFNYFKTGISVTDRGYYFSKEDAQKKMNQGYRQSLLCIEDPLNPGQDICKSSYSFMMVRQAFHYAYMVLCQGVLPHIDQEDEIESILGRIIRVTDEVVTYRQWIQQNWFHKVHPTIPPGMLPMHYLQMMSMHQQQLPDNTAYRIDTSPNHIIQQQVQQVQQQQRANNNNNQTAVNNNHNLSARTSSTSPPNTVTPSPVVKTNSSPKEEGVVVAPAGQGTIDPRTETSQTATPATTPQPKLPQIQQQQHVTESPVVATPPSSNDSDANSAGTLSLPSSQDDLSSCSDAESEHSSVSSKDAAETAAKDVPLPPPQQRVIKAIAKATVSVSSTSAMTPSIIVSSSTSQRTATPPTIKSSAVVVSSASTTTNAITKPKSATRDSEQSAKPSVVATSSVAGSPKSQPPVVTVPATQQSGKASSTTTTVTSAQQPVTTRTYRNKNHQFHSHQGGGKSRNSSTSSSNNNNTATNNNVSGGKRFKRKHKRDSQVSSR